MQNTYLTALYSKLCRFDFFFFFFVVTPTVSFRIIAMLASNASRMYYPLGIHFLSTLRDSVYSGLSLYFVPICRKLCQSVTLSFCRVSALFCKMYIATRIIVFAMVYRIPFVHFSTSYVSSVSLLPIFSKVVGFASACYCFHCELGSTIELS
eukprot:Rmarinus@m.2415